MQQRANSLDLARTTFLGYSNGANLISSLMLLHPGLVERAVLLRAMPVLDDIPPADLSKAEVLVITGAADVTYGAVRAGAGGAVARARRKGRRTHRFNWS